MQPGQAAETVGVTYATAKRWYDKWSDEIRQAIEKRLLPNLEASVKLEAKRHPQPKRKGPSSRTR
jgi:hypothetical protein